MASIFDFSAPLANGEPLELAQFQGQPLLIVNTASKCELTPQYVALEQLYQKYKAQGFQVLAFPCNQFENKEPAQNDEIKQFCELQFGISFPIFSKVAVNGPDALPLFNFLKTNSRGLMHARAIKWNFTKFLINRAGQVEARYAPRTKPEAISAVIESIL